MDMNYSYLTSMYWKVCTPIEAVRISGRKILFTIFADIICMIGHSISFERHYYCIDTYFLPYIVDRILNVMIA